MNQAIYSLLATTIVSLISLSGLALYRFRNFSFVLVSFAVGALLGDAFIHILPQSYSSLPPTTVSWLIIAGVLLFFSIEKFIRWHHCHDPDCQEHDNRGHIVSLSLIGDSVHNFIDGMVIAGAFLVDTKLGLVTTLAVILHEIPQEIGDFGIYIHQGIKLKKALLINLFTSLSAFAGCLLVLGFRVLNFSHYLLPITAGGFIYLAASDLIPELHRHHPALKNSLIQIISVLFGFSLMAFLLLVE